MQKSLFSTGFVKHPLGLAMAALLSGVLLAGCAPTSMETSTLPPVPVDATSAEEAQVDIESGSAAPAAGLSGMSFEYDHDVTLIEAELLEPVEPPFSTRDWTTDFTRRTVEWNEILSGGPPKDGIPAIDEPAYESVTAASDWLSERDPVIFFANNGQVRAYPLAILMWHEIANDEVGGLPVTVTFCPLCNASIVFARQLDDQILDFGTTGRLRNSDLIMYDRQSESWWQQFTGEALIGEHVGRRLNFLPSQVISFGDYAARFPDGDVLARPSAPRDYGRNPYTNYDSSNPFLFDGEIDERLRATERVVGLEIGDDVMAYPFAAISAAGAINDIVGDVPLVVLHKPGTASALDGSEIATSRDVGSAAAFDRRVGDQTLTFSANGDGTFQDAETGSTWTILGEAMDGELTGATLTPLLAFDHFWFAWQAFYPATGLYEE